MFWVMLSRIWAPWRKALHLVKADTVVGWQRKGFRIYWARISQGKRCRPTGSETRKSELSMPLRLQFQLNVRTIHPDFVGVHPLRRRRAEHLAGADLVLGAMPGASDFVALELPL